MPCAVVVGVHAHDPRVVCPDYTGNTCKEAHGEEHVHHDELSARESLDSVDDGHGKQDHCKVGHGIDDTSGEEVCGLVYGAIFVAGECDGPVI